MSVFKWKLLLPKMFQDPNTGFMTNTPLEIFTVTSGRRYRFRLINSFGSVCPAQITFQDHHLVLIATDGEPVQPVKINTIISFSGKALGLYPNILANANSSQPSNSVNY
ncbi:hypothetical protein QAD02_021270 [Eretmocerus hayati]|uniref:Uncharacterized protein n=1 Tax=Eretmocerus hayati TaxID=131215 RepID=A0ACC2PPZ1_9HYME|nr:hypothetical protein QAD02_021270 [Eretmocerus hayati]